MNMYLVIYEIEDEVVKCMQVANEIFNKMDMADCYDISVKRLYLVTDDGVRECVFCGTWSDFSDPLKMWIKDLTDGTVYSVGYGTDH